MEVPKHLGHKPIIAVNNYGKIDAIYANETDVVALSIGKAQYDNDDISAKIWRHNGDRWSRQSEEMPIHRALDLSILVVASFITNGESDYSLTSMREEIVNKDELDLIKSFYKSNKQKLRPRILELKKIIDTYLETEK